MPAQPQQFEGPELQPLLERIRRELGPAATILQAERTRRRSLRSPAGRLLYRLTVAPPDAPTGSAPAARLGQRLAPSPDPFAALADAASDRFEPKPTPALLATLPAPDPAPALDPVPRPAPESPPEPGPGAFAALLAEAAAALDQTPALPPRHSRPAGPSRPDEKPRSARAGLPAPSVRDGAPTLVEAGAGQGSRPAGTRQGERGATASAPPSFHVLECRLRRAGLADMDAEAVARAVGAGQSLEEALVELLSPLSPPPQLPGPTGLTVLVGPRRLAVKTARTLGQALEDPPASVFVVRSDGRLHEAPLCARGDGAGPSPRGVTAGRRSVRPGQRPRLVVLDAGYPPVERRRAKDALAALVPDLSLGVVAATDKPEDMAVLVADLGLDALCVGGLAATASPATVLRAGVPLLLVDDSFAPGTVLARRLALMVQG